MIDMQITFPMHSRRMAFFDFIRRFLSWLFFFAAIVCPAINYFTGGKAWSVVALWAMMMVYKAFISPNILENTALGNILKWSAHLIVLLLLIGLLLAPGWLHFILPLVGFSTIAVSALVFSSDPEKNKKQGMPFMWQILLGLVSFIVVWRMGYPLNWPMIVLGSLSAFLLIAYLSAFGKDFLREFRKRFHING